MGHPQVPGWEDPLADQEDIGVADDPWGAYGILADDKFDDCFRGDWRRSFLFVVFARLLSLCLVCTVSSLLISATSLPNKPAHNQKNLVSRQPVTHSHLFGMVPPKLGDATHPTLGHNALLGNVGGQWGWRLVLPPEFGATFKESFRFTTSSLCLIALHTKVRPSAVPFSWLSPITRTGWSAF